MTTTSSSRLVVLAPPDLESGFLLAGVSVRPVESPEEADTELRALFDDRMQGVIAVYEPYLMALPTERRRRLDTSLSPVVVALPAGRKDAGAVDRRARLIARLQRAIGYHITFGEETE